jgi:hypothetical protein
MFVAGVDADIEISVATQGIGFAGETAVLDSDAVLALGIQFAGQQFGFQSFDDLRESQVELVYLHLTPLTDQAGPIR